MDVPPTCDDRYTAECQRFLAKVSVVGPDECWPWTENCDNHGYGCARFNGRSEGAHRLAYRFLVGGVPPRWHVHHTCATPACCNPAHLKLLSPSDHSRIHNVPLAKCAKCGGERVEQGRKGKNGQRRVCPRCDAIRTSRRYRKDDEAEKFVKRLREEFAETHPSTYAYRLEREVLRRMRDNGRLLAENKKLRLKRDF